MTNDIRMSDLPSSKFDEELKNRMHYEDINVIIINNGEASDANDWTKNFFTYADSYLKNYVDIESEIDGNKRCRDFTYMISEIIENIQKSDKHDDYEFIERNIKNFMINLNSYGYENCPMIESEDYSVIKKKKEIDDILHDITYIRDHMTEIPKSSECIEIKDHVKQQGSIIQTLYDSKLSQFQDVLKFYDFSENYNFKSMEEKINCVTHMSDSHVDQHALPATSESSHQKTTVPVVFSLLGISLISLFYKRASIGSWLNNKIGRKLQIIHSPDEQSLNNLLEHPDEISYPSSHDNKYEILYNPL
ncbi:PIR Superfamily Protein [Plasmodium ovale wallikeri]|uniref:PIR Superfamily Protein n=1 Tax=Plasmodium ovale wallikeri TaxID=864142 RepID=A0A1A8YPN5_PLAOA|nr:PIR Superfamily Protein [Plasmodium ovale wallikeri]SBT59118.1 PIR Superfamily Protein [Plasmodium ovale wallikeri]